jgi:hypothetical protein
MMDYLRTHWQLIVVAAGVLLLLVVVMIFGIRQTIQSGNDPQKVTNFTSPISQLSDSLAINYTAAAAPNMDAVKQQFRIFAADSIGIPDGIRSNIEQLIISAAGEVIIPTYNQTYIHIDSRTLSSCKTDTDCTLSFYVDSPESYYSIHIFKNSYGDQSYTLTQQPLPEVGV